MLSLKQSLYISFARLGDDLSSIRELALVFPEGLVRDEGRCVGDALSGCLPG